MLRNPAVMVWILSLLAVVAMSSTVAAFSRSPGAYSATVQKQDTSSGQSSQDWSGSRYRCVICHSEHAHNITMKHPLRPNCRTCHSGSPSRVGCPTCHSMHTVEYHTSYPTCATCHAQDSVAPGQVQATTVGFVAYLFSKSEFFLVDDQTGE